MNLFPVLLLFLFLCTLTNSSKNPTDSLGDLSVNCGSVETFTARNGREWIGDAAKHKPNSFLQLQGSSTTSTVSHHNLISTDPVPHKTARASRSQFSYAFQVSTGQKILRLHFHSAPHKGFKGFKALFTVEAGPFILLSNFSPSLTADALHVNSFSKEFYLSIRENQQFNLTFTPETSRSLDTTYAFINDIEIIFVPANLSYFQDGEDTNGVKDVGQQPLVYVGHHTALELIHRQSIKHSSAQFPMLAMQKADKVKNEAWKIGVDVGFRYMIRLYFSDIGLKIFGTGDVEFQVLINGMIAQVKNKDDENKIPRFRDYIVTMRGRKKMGKRDLLISLHSYDGLTDGYGLFAGFEIFKLTNSNNSLAGPNPLPPDQGSTSMISSIFYHRNAVTFIAVTMITLLNIVVHKLWEYSETNSTYEENKPSARAERLCRRFSLTEIQSATGNFSDRHYIGRGGFGKVYRGLIDRGHTTVAVKRLKSGSSQGAHEFLMEIETLSELRHVNLVSLIGYCNERREMILVYDYMSGGTLSDQLYKRQRESGNSSSLTWNQRLSICIGAARGLDYLHTGHGVIHRDVKTSNILLNEKLIPKVSDFGLAKHVDRTNLQSHVSIGVKGTNGYIDPHYRYTCMLTRKTDTYAFGVVLFEVLCGKQAVEGERVLTLWACDKINKGEVGEIVDLCLREEISPASRNTFVDIAERCLCEDPKNRPTMSQVVQNLELAVYQQDNKQVLVLNDLLSDIWEEANTRLIKYDWDMIAAATNRFSHSNEIGRGTFGVVYKGQLIGDVIAVKRLSPSYRNEQIINEINILPNLQHRNIIKLLGYCTHTEKMLLVYEFMENGSLDTFIVVDVERRKLLQWELRFKIIIGIARGLVYLQQDSGLRLIHRCVKLSNILLDNKMNPKISSFGDARVVAEGSHFETLRIAGSIGYVAPEFGLHGKCLFKSDVYSFGMLILEIVSGITSTGWFRRDPSYLDCTSLLDYARDLWNERRVCDLVDKSLVGEFREGEALRCIQVGLLCMNEHPDQRPEMSNVLKMLEGDVLMVDPQPWSQFRRENSESSSVHKRIRHRPGLNSTKEKNKPSARAEWLCRHFSLTEIKLATSDFSDGLFIGRGGFGKVYKGFIDGGQTVAVKRLKSGSSQGANEFLMEIETLSELRHVNLVSLIGYCNEGREMILVYDYMSGGTLSDQLYKCQRESLSCPSLTWNQRLSICIGAARGLDYLHTGNGVIHRDVKTSNILLDENFIPKVSDFGLAKHEDRTNFHSHVSTGVKGTCAYMDPHYCSTSKLTRKTDTYAFGVVLFEVLCGKQAVEGERVLTLWARDKINKGEVDEIVDLCLREEISPASRNTFVEIAERCLRKDPKNRPTMSQVVQQLELAVNQQVLVLNKMKIASDDIQRRSVSRAQFPVTSSSVPNLRFTPSSVTVRRAKGNKPLRHWQWEVFWNRVKPFKKNDFLSEIWKEANPRMIKYEWDMIATATNRFSHSCKIGDGLLGAVYKGVLTGHLIAVRRLRPSFEKFNLRQIKKEINFLPSLQHRNIVRLLGCCTHREEMLLVYEFMENGSLDTFTVDDVQRRRLLKWELRFKIIMGIARGIVYLQQDSGLKLIHGDIKSSNILLDTEMNPKICNFGLAGAVAEGHSSVIAGTFGHMAPEYCTYGKSLSKSDVFSFGILILEIVSGIRATRWSLRDPSYAWDLCNEGRVCDLVDESLVGAFPKEEALRCIQVGLLCMHQHIDQRPKMTSVLKMLEGNKAIGGPTTAVATDRNRKFRRIK